MFSTIKSIFQAYILPAKVSGEELTAAKSLVESMISSSQVAVFSKSYCPYCVEAKSLLNKLTPTETIKIIELDHDSMGPAIQSYLASRAGVSKVTVPQVFIHQNLVGGCSDLKALHKDDKLVPHLKA